MGSSEISRFFFVVVVLIVGSTGSVKYLKTTFCCQLSFV